MQGYLRRQYALADIRVKCGEGVRRIADIREQYAYEYEWLGSRVNYVTVLKGKWCVGESIVQEKAQRVVLLAYESGDVVAVSEEPKYTFLQKISQQMDK